MEKILIIALLIELALALYDPFIKADQKRNIRSIYLAVYSILIIFSSISILICRIQWKIPAVLALVFAILGLVANLLHKNMNVNKPDRKVSTFRAMIRKIIAMVLLAIIALIPAALFPDYDIIGTTGAYKVATVMYTYTDEARIETYKDTGENRNLNVAFWYPKETNEKYPLIVFSHGSFGLRTSNESLYHELASHGYVVCAIDHVYQCLYTKDTDGNAVWLDRGFMQEVSQEDAKKNKQQSYKFYQKWMNIRTGDINFVIDYLLEKSDNNDKNAPYNFINKGKIGVMGHSLGGAAALGMGRIRQDIRAVMALEAPFLCDIEGVDQEKERFVFTDKAYPVPVLNIYSDSSWEHLSEWAQYAKNHALLSETDEIAYNVHIQGTGHLTLTDLSLTSPFLSNVLSGYTSTTDTEYCLKTINELTLAFFDCYLKDKEQFLPKPLY